MVRRCVFLVFSADNLVEGSMAAVVSVFGLAPRYIGGGENYARELSLQLAEKGWYSVLCFLTPPPEEVRRYLDLPNVSIEVLENSHLAQPKLATIKKLSAILKKHQARILHLHMVGFVGLFPWVARLRSVERVFFTHHMSNPEGYVPQRAALWKRQLVRAINWPMSAVICVSEYNRKSLSTLGLLPNERFKRIYNGVDFSRVSNSGQDRRNAFRQRWGIPSDRIVIAQISWIIAAKGVGDVLQATKIAVAKNSKIHFVLVGEGDERDSFMRKAEELGVSDHITWTGVVTDPFAEGVYDSADIVCQASRWEEAFGQVITEAMACSRPVVATRVGGIPELIADGKSGFLVERGDAEQLAERILQLASDPSLRAEMGRAGHLAARSRFELGDIVRQVMDLYGIVKVNGAAGATAT
jgi:glycosyltransferase involved in cell wall biosynthesis